ncbi:MAG: hypothetical protein NUV51_03810 [Sulfuricaulis sp.]|nr:hypothetical protein [Sulfuricaulis sp.]
MPGQPMTRRSRFILEELGATPEWWEIALDRIASGDSPKDIADEYCIVFGAFMRWISGDEERSKGYAEALRIAAEGRAHECIPIADNEAETADTQRDKLRIDTRLRLASKWDRGRYGEKEAANGGTPLRDAKIEIVFVSANREPQQLEHVVGSGKAEDAS